MTDVQNWRGDGGLTDLIDRKDLPKDDLRFDVLGHLDEASSALGVVRATTTSKRLKGLILGLQRDLCWMMSDLAAISPEGEAHPPLERVLFLETEFHRRTAQIPMGDAFVVPGDSATSAALHLARSVVRRAERSVTRLGREAGLPNQNIVPYLNRLSAFLFVLARQEDSFRGKSSTLAHASTRKP